MVIGGTGFIGTPLVERLVREGYDITLLIEKGGFSNKLSSCKYFIGDLLDKGSFTEKINSFDLVINLAAIIRTVNKKKYQENIKGARNLVEILEEKGIKQLIHFSTQNVNLKEKGPYTKSKEAAEKIVRDSKLDYLIVRPNYVYAINKTNDFFRLASMISRFRVAVVIGKGNNKIQPVLREDLVDAVMDCVGNFSPRSIVEISGRETLSINEVVSLIKEGLKVKPLVLHVPLSILKIFKSFVPFDVNGYTEDRMSVNPFPNSKFSLFTENLKEILELLK